MDHTHQDTKPADDDDDDADNAVGHRRSKGDVAFTGNGMRGVHVCALCAVCVCTCVITLTYVTISHSASQVNTNDNAHDNDSTDERAPLVAH
jgi:hypothetical protein